MVATEIAFVDNSEEEEEKVKVEETKVQSILDKIAPVAEKPPTIKMVIYGNPGVGKTVFAASAPRPLFLDAEHGTRSLLNHKEHRQVPVLPINSFDELYDLFWEVRGGNSFFDDIDTFVIDSLSELQKRQMDELLKAASKKDANRNPYLPYQGDYKENTEAMRRLVIAFRDLNKNLILISHAKEDKDDSTGALYWRPAVTPKLSETIEGIVDVLGFMSAEMDESGGITERRIQVMPSRRVKAKTRIGGLPAVLVNPTFNDFAEAETDG